MHPKRICMLVTSELSHDPRVTKEARVAFESGYDVCVICRDNFGGDPPYRVRTFKIERPDSLIWKYVERFLSLFLMTVYLLLERPGLIHANDVDTLPVAFICGKLLHARVVYDSHELWPEGSQRLRGLMGRLVDKFQSLVLRRIDGVVTVNEYIAEMLTQRYKISRPVIVVKNTPYLRGHQSIFPRSWLNNFEGKKIILYITRYSPNRGFNDAMKAMKYLPEEAVLIFRGFGPLENQMKKNVEDLNLTKRVFFLPPAKMEEIVLESMGADVGLSLYDPVNRNLNYASPNKLFGLMMAGVPIIGSDIPFLRTFLLENDVGCVYTPGNPKSLADAILSIINNRANHSRMKKNCIKCRKIFCWEKESIKLLKLYSEIL